jgi:hypothetical protein
MDSSTNDQSRSQPPRNPRARGCELTLVKGRHTWRFCCEHAEEPSLLSVIAEIATSAHAGLDQFDLAVLASQLQDHFAADHEAEIHDPSEARPPALPSSPVSTDRPARSVGTDDSPSHHRT